MKVVSDYYSTPNKSQ